MALENYDFDVEIDEVGFEIENDGWEAPSHASFSTSQDEETEENHANNNNHDLKNVDRVDSNRVISKGSAIHVVDTRRVEAQDNQCLDSGNGDAQMDDGFDDLLSQIDETEIKKMTTTKETSKSAKRHSILNPLNVEASFFSSQEDTNARPPLKRRFPGPAGLLPNLQKAELKFINMTPHPLYQKVSKLVSQTSENNTNSNSTSSIPVHNDKIRGGSEILLSKAPWKKMTKSLNLNIKNENDLLNIVNIKWLREKAKKYTDEIRIPFLAVVVQGTLEANSSKKKLRYKNPSVKLMDPTGTIVAAFNPNFVDAYGDKIIPGTALALRNCRVLTLKKHVILTVAKKNLLYLATTKTDTLEDDHNTDVQDSKTDPEIKTEKDVFEIKNGSIPLEKILEEYDEISAKLNAPKPVFQDQTEISNRANGNFSRNDSGLRPSLFSTVTSKNALVSEPQRVPSLVPEKTAATALNQFQQNREFETSNFSASASSGFDDDDDDELLQALECVDFVIDEDSM